MRYLGGRKEKFDGEIKWVREQLQAHNIDKMGLGQIEDAHTTMIAQLRKVKDEEGLLSEEEIMQEVLTMGGAGHETTGNTVSWALYLVAKNPDAQAKLREELDAHSAGSMPTFDEARNSLPYTLSTIYETLRIYPTVPLFPRQCTKAGVKIDGVDIPKGAMVIVVTNAIHRDARYFPEPLLFKPERFVGTKAPANTLPVGAPNGPAFAFMPFGAGARTCVGQRFAILEAVVLLASIIKRFEVSIPVDEVDRVKEHLAITLRPVNLRLVFKRREVGATQTEEHETQEE